MLKNINLLIQISLALVVCMLMHYRIECKVLSSSPSLTTYLFIYLFLNGSSLRGRYWGSGPIPLSGPHKPCNNLFLFHAYRGGILRNIGENIFRSYIDTTSENTDFHDLVA